MLCVCVHTHECVSVFKKKKQRTLIYIDSSLRLWAKILYLSLPYINKAILALYPLFMNACLLLVEVRASENSVQAKLWR